MRNTWSPRRRAHVLLQLLRGYVHGSLGSCPVNDTCTIYRLICYPITNLWSLPHISAHNRDCKMYERCVINKSKSWRFNTETPCWVLLLCELLLQPIGRGRILFIPVTAAQRTIKVRMCNREITAVGFNNRLQCWLCEFWCDYCSIANDAWMRADILVGGGSCSFLLLHIKLSLLKTKLRHWRAQSWCG